MSKESKKKRVIFAEIPLSILLGMFDKFCSLYLHYRQPFAAECASEVRGIDSTARNHDIAWVVFSK